MSKDLISNESIGKLQDKADEIFQSFDGYNTVEIMVVMGIINQMMTLNLMRDVTLPAITDTFMALMPKPDLVTGKN
jgi:hypothetical protein